jgi:hypothetical protein
VIIVWLNKRDLFGIWKLGVSLRSYKTPRNSVVSLGGDAKKT